MNRRYFITATAAAAGAALAAKAQSLTPDIKVDGGLAPLKERNKPVRTERIVPPGALSVKNFYSRCTACQLCVSVCPEHVLKPGSRLENILHPVMNYEDGWCRPECTACSEVCPSGAIRPISREQKTAIRIGTAKVDASLCLSATGKEGCGNCAHHCPTGALSMMEVDGHRRPVVNEEQCIGCGACEHLCPVRPVSAITVNGLSTHQSK